MLKSEQDHKHGKVNNMTKKKSISQKPISEITEMSEHPYKLYILMRNDLESLNPGKAMAQAAHASNLFVAQCEHIDAYASWRSTCVPFGTTIVLGCNRKELGSILNKSIIIGVHHGTVYDETYPFITTKEISELISPSIQTAPAIIKDNGQVVMFRRELTCGYIFISDDDINKSELIGDLTLHP